MEAIKTCDDTRRTTPIPRSKGYQWALKSPAEGGVAVCRWGLTTLAPPSPLSPLLLQVGDRRPTSSRPTYLRGCVSQLSFSARQVDSNRHPNATPLLFPFPNNANRNKKRKLRDRNQKSSTTTVKTIASAQPDFYEETDTTKAPCLFPHCPNQITLLSCCP